MELRNGDLPCAPRHLRKDSETRETLPDGRVRVSRTVHWIDRRGEKDAHTESWVEEAAP